MDMEEKKLTLIGEMDPVQVADKLKRRWKPYLLTVEPAND